MSGQGNHNGGGAARDYWNSTHRPLVCLVFLTPLLAVYETGVHWLGGRDSDGLRNGADYWMREALDYLGLNQTWVLPTTIVVGLLIWHLASGNSWEVPFETMIGMFAESLLFAFVLVVLGQFQDYTLRHLGNGVTASIGSERLAALAIVYVGAGIYEEVLFRLCLMPACYGFFRCGNIGHKWAISLAVVATSLAFSIAHYVGPSGEEFRLFTFGFRVLAGLFFAILFVLRGFGITVGAHAAYDLIVGLLLSQVGRG